MVQKMNYVFTPKDKNRELCTESQMSNTNVMDSNNNKLLDGIWKYAFKLSKTTIIIINLDVSMPKIHMCVLL